MAGKRPGGDKPKVEPPKTSAGVKNPRTNVKVSAEDLDRINRLKVWDKKGKLTGDVQGLEKRLRSIDPETLKEAQNEFDEANERMAKGERVHLEDSGDPRAQTSQGTSISTGDKSELENSGWLKRRLSEPEDRRDYMAWLKKGHKEGELGAEIEPGQTATERHEHLRPGSPEAEASVREWERGMGRRRD
jgi:hypothetical protein